tara:strand:- start:192 stop:1682 length:1491 start_codon:yes stop_codon:yes gene_type:complete
MSAQVPDLMKIGSVDTEMTQDVQTIITDPVVFNQNTCRFTLQHIGFWHSNSRLSLELEPDTSASKLNAMTGENCNATYSVMPAISSLIERVNLSVGGKTICELEDFAHFDAYKGMFIPNEVNKDRESIISGKILNHGLAMDAGSGDLASGYTIDNGTYPHTQTQATGAFIPLNASNTTSASFSPGTNGTTGIFPNDNLLIRNGPSLTIPVSSLFPFLFFNQLPLYMIDEEVSINITWTPLASDRRACVQAEDPEDQRFSIRQNSVQLISDYLTYDQNIMNAYRDANRDMNFNYVDYRLAKRSYSASTTGQVKQVLNVGGAGRIVSRLVVGMSDDNVSSDNLLNAFTSTAPGVVGANVQTLTTNVRSNDEYLYSIDRNNLSTLFHDVRMSEGLPPNVSRDEYSGEGGGGGGGLSIATDALYNGYQVGLHDSGLRGNFFYQGYKMNKNERINSRGIELETQYSQVPALSGAETYTQRCWIEVLRTATLIDGKMECYYA